MDPSEQKQDILVEKNELDHWGWFKQEIVEHLNFIDVHFNITETRDGIVTSLTLKDEYNGQNLHSKKRR